MQDRKKDQDETNGVKLRGIVNDKGDFEKRLFLRANCTTSWVII